MDNINLEGKLYSGKWRQFVMLPALCLVWKMTVLDKIQRTEKLHSSLAASAFISVIT